MKAEALPIGAVLGEKRRFEVPIYQRTYAWTENKQLSRFFEHIVASHLRKVGVSVAAFTSAFENQTGDTVRFPSDQELQAAIRTRVIYGNIASRRLAHLLGDLELMARDKFDEDVSLPKDLTVEHVLPNSWIEHWPLADGSKAPTDWSAPMTETIRAVVMEREHLKHTLGNLTLLTPAANPSYSNSPFTGEKGKCKRDRLRSSLLKLNQDIADCACWDEIRIRDRADRLARLANVTWPAPGAIALTALAAE